MKLGLVAVLLLAVGALALGCGDSSDTLTLEEYFAEFDAISADLDEQFEEASAIISDEEFFADEANLAPFKDFAAAVPRIAGDFVDRLKALDPPSEVEAEHDDLVNAVGDFVLALEEDNKAVGEAETMAEIEALEAPFRTVWGPPGARVDDACFELVLVADANGITVSNPICGDE